MTPEAEQFASAAETRYLREKTVDPSRGPHWTPYEIGFLLWYYFRSGEPSVYEFPPSGVRNDTREKLIELDLLQDGTPAIITSRGRAFIDSLLRVPLPEAVWVTKWPERSDV